MIPFSYGILGETRKLASEGGRKRDLIVITLVSLAHDPFIGS